MMRQKGLSKIRVSLDVLNADPERPRDFDAWTDGRRWNGWATPMFEKQTADAIVSAFKEKKGTKAQYDAKTDSYRFVDEDGGEEAYGPALIGEKKLFAIGSGLWVWEDA